MIMIFYYNIGNCFGIILLENFTFATKTDDRPQELEDHSRVPLGSCTFSQKEEIKQIERLR